MAIIQFRDRLNDSSVYPISKQAAILDSSGSQDLTTYITEYNISLHKTNKYGSQETNPRYDTSIFTIEEAVVQVPDEYRHGGLKLIFNASSSSDSSMMVHVETYELNSNEWSNDVSKWYRNDGVYNNYGLIYDVTKNNNGITFNSLQELLSSSNLSTLIPVKYRTGGMTIRFVLTSDNKYVQYRLMSDTFNTTPEHWQGVDDVYDTIHEEYGDPTRLNQLEDWGDIANESTLRDMLSDENNLSKEHTQHISFNVGGTPGFAIVNYYYSGADEYYEEYNIAGFINARTWTVGESSSQGWTAVSPLLLNQRINYINGVISYVGLGDMPTAKYYGLYDSAADFEDVCTHEDNKWMQSNASWLIGRHSTNNCILMILNIRGKDVTINGATHRKYTQYYFLNGNLYTRNVDSEDGATAWYQVTLDGWRLRTATNSSGQEELQLYNGNYLSGAVLVSDLTADVTSRCNEIEGSVESEVQRAKEAEALLDERKADIEGSYETMSVGSAKTLEANMLTAVEFTKRVVPSSVGSGASKLSLLKGNTLVWNQMIPLFSNSAAEITNGVTWSYDKDTGLFTFQGTCTGGTSFRTNLIMPWIKMLTGHKYLIFNAGRDGGNTPTLSVRAGSSYVPNNSYDTRNTIITKSEPIGSSSSAIYIRFRAGETYNGSCYFNIFDLTRMFGKGNEPSSAEEFEALFPRENYAYADEYNTPWLMNFQGTGLKSTGSDFEQTLPLNVTTLKGKSEGSDTEVVMFPDGLKKVEDVYDEIDYKNGIAIKRVGSVDLGTLGYTFIENDMYPYFRAPIDNIAAMPNNKLNYICAKYDSISPISVENMAESTLDRIVARRMVSQSSGSNIMYIRDLGYPDVATFKAAMQGVMLYYELATPIVYHFEPMNNVYRVEQGGTEEVVRMDSDEADGRYYPLTAPMIADIRYSVDVVGILGDPNRFNQLEDWGNLANESALRDRLSDENYLSKEHTQRISFNVGGKAGFAIVNYHGNKLYYEEYFIGVSAYARDWTTGTSSSSGWHVVDPLTLYDRINSIGSALSGMPSGENYGAFDNAKEFEDACTQETGGFNSYPAQWLVGINTTNNCSLMILNIRGNDVTINGLTHRKYTQYYFLNGNLYVRNIDSEDGATGWHQVTLDGWRLRTATNSGGQKELQLYNGNYLSGSVLVSDLTADVTTALGAAVERIATLESKVAALESKMAQVDTILQDLIVSDSSTNNTNNK